MNKEQFINRYRPYEYQLEGFKKDLDLVIQDEIEKRMGLATIEWGKQLESMEFKIGTIGYESQFGIAEFFKSKMLKK